jgi:hypothetical protein
MRNSEQCVRSHRADFRRFVAYRIMNTGLVSTMRRDIAKHFQIEPAWLMRPASMILVIATTVFIQLPRRRGPAA